MRLFGEYLAGSTSDITADDFTPEEIDEIRSRVNTAKKHNVLQEESLKAQLLRAREEVARDGSGGFYGMEDGKRTSPEEYLKGISDKLATYGNTKGKTSVSYGNGKEDSKYIFRTV